MLKIFNIGLKDSYQLLLLSVILSMPVIILGENIIFLLPILVVVMFAYIFGERFILTIIIISLFTLVGEVSRTLRSLVYVFDFTFLGYFFLNKFGLNFRFYPRVPRSVIYFLLLYFFTMLISSTISKFPFAGIGIITQQAAFFVIVYVFYSLISSQENIKNYFSGIYLVALIIVLFSLIAFFNEGFSLIEIIAPNRPRVSVITGNIEASTNFFVVALPLIISSLLYKKKFSDKNFEYFLLFFFSFGLILMMSRSAILGILLSTAIVLFFLKRKRFYQLIMFISVLVLIFIFYQPLNELLTTFLRLESGMSARDYLWKMSMDMINDNTIFGIGPGAYQYEMLNYFPYMLNDWWGKIFIYYIEVTGGANLSHNFFLTFFTDMGILGIVTAILLPVVYFRIGIKTIIKYKNRDTDAYYLIVALFAAGASIILRNFFNGIGLLYVGGIQTDLPFWLVFSSLIYFYRLPNKIYY
jgi:O-antigen ligase